MAQIQVSIDTEGKTISLTIDGTTIPDVEDVSVYTYRDSNGNVTSLDVSMYTTTKTENGVSKRVSYHAYASEVAKNLLAIGAEVYKDVPGFIGVEDTTQAARDIDDFLTSRKRPV